MTAEAPAQPRSKAEIGLITVFAICAAMVLLNRTGIAYLFEYIQPQMKLTNAQFGQLMSATSFAWAISSVIFSVASDAFRIPPRRLILGCVIGFSVVSAMTARVSSFEAFLWLRIAMGIFEGPVFPLMMAGVAADSPAERRGANFGIIMGVSSMIAAVIGPAMLIGMAADMGWRFAFVALALPGPLLALAIWTVMKPQNGLTPPAEVERIDLRSALKFCLHRNIVIALIGSIALVGAIVAWAAFVPIHISSLTAFTAGGGVLLLTALGAADAIGGGVVPALSDRFGRKKCLIFACLFTALAPVAIALLATSSWWLLAAIPLALFATGAFTLMVYIIPGETVPPQMTASVYAMLIFAGEIIGGVAAPALAGTVADSYGLAAAQLVAAGFAAVAFVVALFVVELFVVEPGRAPPSGQD